MKPSAMKPSMNNRLIRIACAGLMAFAGVGPALTSPAIAQSYNPGSVSTVALGSQPRLVNVPRGGSFAVDLPGDARDVVVSDPTVAEAVLHSPRRITVIGLKSGETDATFIDASGRTILALRVRVDAGVNALQDTLSRVAPGSQVHVEAVNDSILLTGLATSPAESDRIAQVARAFVSAPEKVMNMMTVAGSDQVTLKVRVVEVQRNVIKQLGLNSDVAFNTGLQSVSFGRANTFGVNGTLQGGGGMCFGENRARTTNYSNSNTVGNSSTSGTTSSNTITGSTQTTNGTTFTTSDGRTLAFNGTTPDSVVVTGFNGQTQTLTGDSAVTYLRNTLAGSSGTTASSSLQEIIAGFTSGNSLSNVAQSVASSAYSTIMGTNASSCLQAFERVGLIRTLAEPNLTSVNGESASFLAGGEFPVPVARDREGQVTVEYKPYGVSLAFRPVVTSGGNISMQINVEVSELSNTGGLTIGAGTVSSITLPGLTVRRSQTTVEMPSGGSMMIAGLLQESARQTVDSLPGISGLPVLGSLFRSRDFLQGETELVVIIEPYIVSPTSPGRMQTPADGLRIASDIQTVLFGQLNQAYGSPAPTGIPGTEWQGPVGYVIE